MLPLSKGVRSNHEPVSRMTDKLEIAFCILLMLAGIIGLLVLPGCP